MFFSLRCRMDRPDIQDCFARRVRDALIGEGYKAKRDEASRPV